MIVLGARRQSVYAVLFLLAVAGAYASTFSRSHGPLTAGYDYHSVLANSLIHGHVDLVYPKRIHDLVAWEGRYYLPWGPMPALAIIPLLLAFGSINELYLSAALGAACIFVWYGISRSLRRDGFADFTVAESVLFACLSVLGNDFYWISTRGTVWYISQSFTFFFMSSAVYLMLQRGYGAKAASSALFSCALLTRLGVFVISPFFYLMLVCVSLKEGLFGGSQGMRRRAGLLFILVLPFLAATSLNFLYNYARFGDPFESGLNNVMQHVRYYDDLREYGPFSLHYLPHNLDVYFLSPVGYVAGPPYMVFSLEGNSFWSYQPYLLIPVIAFLGLVRGAAGNPRAAALWRRRGEPAFFIPVLSFAAWAAYLPALLLFFVTGWYTFGNRYLLDVQPFMLLLTAFSFGRIRKNTALRRLSYLAIALSVLVGYQAKALFDQVNGTPPSMLAELLSHLGL
jgi:hypothetical protein